jgi:RimJ/RimL family protein N-acetyltransferase
MILLEKESYKKLIEPLTKMKINNLMARSVVEHCISGKIYVDNIHEPQTYYVVHPYGICLLFGDCKNQEFNSRFKDYALNVNKIRQKYEWMLADPGDWDIVLNELFKDHIIKSSDNIENKETEIIEVNTRVNFKFNLSTYLNYKKNNSVEDLKIVRTDKQMFREMKGSVIPLYFWDNADDFYEKGIGFTLFHDDKLASTAYSAFIHDDKLELGIETVEEFRGKGFAQYTCSRLIDYCIENNYEPVWSCKLENTGSYKLAQKLGFEPTLKFPFYRLSR